MRKEKALYDVIAKRLINRIANMVAMLPGEIDEVANLASRQVRKWKVPPVAAASSCGS